MSTSTDRILAVIEAGLAEVGQAVTELATHEPETVDELHLLDAALSRAHAGALALLVRIERLEQRVRDERRSDAFQAKLAAWRKSGVPVYLPRSFKAAS